MAGTIVANTINTDTAGGVFTTNNAMTGIPKAWAYITGSGSTITVANSYNVSSITRVSAGSYYVDFTTAMPNANYSVVGSTSIGIAINNYCMFVNSGITPAPYFVAQTSTRFYYLTYVFNVGPTEANYTAFAVFSS
jgi:hypothetical protein